jgi:hypothetical protein
MSLSDRLHAAARAREGRPEPAPRIQQATTVTIVEEPVRVKIIATASRTVQVTDPDPSAAPDAVCPTCGRTGELGVVDLPYRTADWSCVSCGTLWQVTLPQPAEE